MARKANPRSRKRAKPRIEELERRIALTTPANKKSPTPAPYLPGTLYGLARRSNIREV